MFRTRLTVALTTAALALTGVAFSSSATAKRHTKVAMHSADSMLEKRHTKRHTAILEKRYTKRHT